MVIDDSEFEGSVWRVDSTATSSKSVKTQNGLYLNKVCDAITIKNQQSEIKALRVKIELLRVNLDKALNALDVKI